MHVSPTGPILFSNEKPKDITVSVYDLMTRKDK
jgi:hypothetical protein